MCSRLTGCFCKDNLSNGKTMCMTGSRATIQLIPQPAVAKYVTETLCMVLLSDSAAMPSGVGLACSGLRGCFWKGKLSSGETNGRSVSRTVQAPRRYVSVSVLYCLSHLIQKCHIAFRQKDINRAARKDLTAKGVDLLSVSIPFEDLQCLLLSSPSKQL